MGKGNARISSVIALSNGTTVNFKTVLEQAKTRLHQQNREFDATEHKQEILQCELQEAQRRMETRRSESGVEVRMTACQLVELLD